VKREEPTCRRCRIRATTEVDHIVALEQGGAPFDRANLQGLCGPCHREKTREDQAT
jgi:5-methylcytosine-specific restriction enzyme A